LDLVRLAGRFSLSMLSFLPHFEPVRLVLQHLTFASMVDILAVAFVVYECLLLVRGTRASQILIGLVLLALVYYASEWGGLLTLHWLLSAAIPYFVFAVIVLFQSELRQGLAKMGRRSRMLRLGRPAGSEDGYEDVVLAANFLAAHRIGGLIVLERDTGLRTYIESGVALDAVVGYDLLVTIFRPGGPLHDGAVVVQGNRIAAAACFLPISMNPVLSSQLGTRHRAAIGITEETDAVAVVISESTGAISLAVGGKIELDITPEQLRERLSDLFEQYLAPLALPSGASTSTEYQPAQDTRGEWPKL
jgi:diadenylate cyclase